jgi:hypothetical protein
MHARHTLCPAIAQEDQIDRNGARSAKNYHLRLLKLERLLLAGISRLADLRQ